MITEDLYRHVLLKPAIIEDANILYMVSGYASATFMRRHVLNLSEINESTSVNLIIGMPWKKTDHLAFVKLHEEFHGRIKGYYYQGPVQVHSKVYSWYKNNKEIVGFSGSANYSQYGFFEAKQINQMVEDDPYQIKDFYHSLLKHSIYIPEAEIEDEHNIFESIPLLEGSVAPGQIEWIETDKAVRISFLDRNGILPKSSGLNWGQRKSKNINRRTGEVTWSQRDPDQAYLSLKKDSRNEGFLPERGYTFTLLTDDGQSFDCVVAQDGRKGIQTTHDNSILGKYFRHRMGKSSGEFLTTEDLVSYGRTDFTIVKVDEETFLLDFSVNS